MPPSRRAARARRPQTPERDKLFHQLMHLSRLASLGSLSSGIAHEVNNPLVAVKGFAQLIEMDGSASEEIRDRAREIIKAAVRIQKICDHLRTYAKEMQQDEWTPVDINETIEQSMILLNQQLTYRRISVSHSLDRSLPKVWGIRNHLERVFHNLLTNSRDALSKNKGERLITIQTTLGPDGKVCVTYADNGGGIPQSIREKVFDPFFTTKDGHSSAGLGLSIVKDIVESHKGTLDLTTIEGEGTKIVLLFPVTKVVAKRQEPKGTRLHLVAPEKKWRMLVIDDELVAADLMAHYAAPDFDSRVCSNAREALQIIDTEPFDLIVTDLNMPEFTGVDILTHVRDRGLDTPVIIMSGYGDSDQEVSEAMSRGAVAFLQKPFEGPVEVREFLRNWVESSALISRFAKR